MKSRKYWVMGATATMVLVSSPAVAATLSNGNGQTCGGAVGVWHFVNNQTGGETKPGTLSATFTGGGAQRVTAYKVNQNVQHFSVTSTGQLVTASTNLDGRLVLSDFTCGDVVKK